MSVPITSQREKHYDFLYDDLAFEKLMRYYGFGKKRTYLSLEDSAYTGLVITIIFVKLKFMMIFI